MINGLPLDFDTACVPRDVIIRCGTLLSMWWETASQFVYARGTERGEL
jgi:hypothetical protein